MKRVFTLAVFVLWRAIAICYAQDKPYYAFYPFLIYRESR